jgi:hypothetical protein
MLYVCLSQCFTRVFEIISDAFSSSCLESPVEKYPSAGEGCNPSRRAAIRRLISISIRCIFERKLQVFMQPRLHVSETQSLDPRAVMSMAPQRPRLRLLRSQTLFCDDGWQACGCATEFFPPTDSPQLPWFACDRQTQTAHHNSLSMTYPLQVHANRYPGQY